MTVHFKLNVYISVLVEKLYDSYLPPLLYLGVFAELKSIHTPIMVKTYQQERHLLPQASVGPKSSVPKKSRSGHSRWQHFCCSDEFNSGGGFHFVGQKVLSKVNQSTA